MTAPQIVLAAAVAAVVIAIALVAVGVALVAGLGWSLVTAGALVGPSAVAAAVILLRDSGQT